MDNYIAFCISRCRLLGKELTKAIFAPFESCFGVRTLSYSAALWKVW